MPGIVHRVASRYVCVFTQYMEECGRNLFIYILPFFHNGTQGSLQCVPRTHWTLSWKDDWESLHILLLTPKQAARVGEEDGGRGRVNSLYPFLWPWLLCRQHLLLLLESSREVHPHLGLLFSTIARSGWKRERGEGKAFPLKQNGVANFGHFLPPAALPVVPPSALEGPMGRSQGEEGQGYGERWRTGMHMLDPQNYLRWTLLYLNKSEQHPFSLATRKQQIVLWRVVCLPSSQLSCLPSSQQHVYSEWCRRTPGCVSV